MLSNGKGGTVFLFPPSLQISKIMSTVALTPEKNKGAATADEKSEAVGKAVKNNRETCFNEQKELFTLQECAGFYTG